MKIKILTFIYVRNVVMEVTFYKVTKCVNGHFKSGLLIEIHGVTCNIILICEVI